MSVEIRAALPGDGPGLAQIWLDNAHYYVRLFPADFREPDETGLVDWFETYSPALAKNPSCTSLPFRTARSRRLSMRV